MADEIVRDNPYGNDAPPSTPEKGKITVPETTVVGNPISPAAAQAIGPPDKPLDTSPLSTQGYFKSQLESAEERKYLTAQGAEVSARGADREFEIRDRAAQEDLRRQNESEMALKQAMIDANNRDAALRKQIQQAAAQQVDPAHWWNSRSTGGKVLAGIGMILGGMGGGLARTGQNPAMQIINKAVDDDINSQREHIAGSWKAISTQHELDDTAFNREMHRQAWENNYRTAGYERVKMELAASAAKTTSESVRQNALVGIQDLNDAQAKIRNQQYVLGQQAAMANAARLRKLTEEAGKQVMELVKEKGVDPTAAEQFVYQQPQYRELMGAGMVPRSVAQLPILRTQAAADIEKLKGFGYSDKDAAEKVLSDPKYAPLIQTRGPIVPAGREGQETEEQMRNRTIMVGGNPSLAPNKEIADKYNNFTEAAPTVQKLYGDLRKAWEDGDPGRYSAARDALIEVLPKYYGFNRGPSVAQVRETIGGSIPEYGHWYPGGGGVQGETGVGALERQRRVTNALDILGQTLNTQSDAMRSQAGLPPAQPAVPAGKADMSVTGQAWANTPWGSSLPKPPDFKPKIDFTPTVQAPVVKRPQEK